MTGLKAAPWPQVAAHRSFDQTRAENYEIPAAAEGEARGSGVRGVPGERAGSVGADSITRGRDRFCKIPHTVVSRFQLPQTQNQNISESELVSLNLADSFSSALSP